MLFFICRFFFGRFFFFRFFVSCPVFCLIIFFSYISIFSSCFSTFSWPVLGVVALWLLACGAREKFGIDDLNWWRFNIVQVIVGGLTVIALLSILTALPQGLLGTPDMHVTGHQSYGTELGWFADRSTSVLPRASAFTPRSSTTSIRNPRLTCLAAVSIKSYSPQDPGRRLCCA